MKNRQISKGLILTIASVVIAAFIVLIFESPTGLDLRPRFNKTTTGELSESSLDEAGLLTTLYRTINLVQRSYLDASRINPRNMLISAMEALQLEIPMLIAAEENNQLKVSMGENKKNFQLNDIKTPWILLQRFKEIYNFLRENKADEDLDFEELQYSAINGMLRSLDPHTVLLSPNYYRSMKDRTHGNFGGVGIVISIKDGELTVISPMEGSPAHKSGLKSGDVITRIDEASTVNMPINDAVDLMRGQPETQVTLRIKREGWDEEKDYKITRAIIEVRSIDSSMIEGQIGYLRIHDFQANTAQDTLNHLQKLESKGALRGLILDLRSNPGGLLTAAIEISDLFLSKGVIVTTAGQKLSERKVQRAQNRGIEPTYPIAVLVNSGSASASEIVAGALKENNRAVIIGEQTFGKGSVQILHEFEDNSALKMTTAQYLTPGDISIQSVGITPHIELVKIRADPKNIDLGKSITIRERNLHHHFENRSSLQQAQKPLFRLEHLQPISKADEQDATAQNDDDKNNNDDDEENDEEGLHSTYNFKFKSDYEIELAAELLTRMHSAKAKQVDQATLLPVVKKHERIQQKKLIAQLKKLGIDWSESTTSTQKTPQLQTEVKVSPKTVQAGTEAVLEVSVTNKSDTPIFRLLGVTHSDFRPADQKSMAFGRINPGQTITRTLKFTVTKSTTSRVDDIRIDFEDSGKNDFLAQAVRFSIEEIPNPVLSLNTHLVDIQGGNGDNILQPGETVDLITTIKNSGLGEAHDVHALLTNESGNLLFIVNGRAILGKIPVEETKQARFSFTLNEDFKEQSVKLKLTVFDREMRIQTSELLEYTIAPPVDFNTVKKTLEVKEKTNIYTDPHKTNIFGTLIPGTIVPSTAQTDSLFRVGLALNKTGWVNKAKLKPSLDNAPEEIEYTKFVNPPPDLELFNFQQVVNTEKITLQGKASDNNHVRNIYIFRNNSKLFFKPGKTKELEFSAELNLVPGANFITIVAEETRELQTRRTIFIRRDGKDKMPYISTHDIEGTPIPLGVIPSSHISD